MSYSTAFFHASLAVVLAVGLALFASSTVGQDSCVVLDAPNPIAQQYPSTISGNLNGTAMIVPIPLEIARKFTGFNILEHAYQSLLPDLPKGMYPMMVSGYHDHDIQLPVYSGPLTPDFSRAALEFPFVDALGDNYTSFRLQKNAMITASNTAAVQGTQSYGVNAIPALLDPPCNAYRAKGDGSYHFSAEAANASCEADRRYISLDFRPSPNEVPYSLDFLKNITEQVTFGNSTTMCDNYQRLYNTSLSAGAFQPIPVKGTITAKMEPFEGQPQTWKGVYGWRFSTAFLEPPVLSPCSAFQGYRSS